MLALGEVIVSGVICGKKVCWTFVKMLLSGLTLLDRKVTVRSLIEFLKSQGLNKIKENHWVGYV